jgi:ribose/xylose/arabinose/galactoside ABC-type transport system permease subunit
VGQGTKNKLSILFSENSPELLLLILIVAIVTISPIFSDVFLTKTNILNMLRQSSYLVIVTIGMMIVIITGSIFR